ncbi:MAG: hypothetical protein HC920_03225 [Oscillatoriales cyanobacterium SM2_3_0]|nr:hypothetical protein [Oscillatoriales cyanobacterium SM2_3_0]
MGVGWQLAAVSASQATTELQFVSTRFESGISGTIFQGYEPTPKSGGGESGAGSR